MTPARDADPEAIVASVRAVLRTCAGEVLTEAVISERARNVVQALVLRFDVRQRTVRKRRRCR